MTTSDIHRETYQDVWHYEFEDVDGGTLVYTAITERRGRDDETRRVGRRLVGFRNVTDWDGVRSELARRGHDVGAIHQLPVIDGPL